MSTRKVIRPDQHGTQTGYQYGCRDACCREAHKHYRKGLRAEGRDPQTPRPLERRKLRAHEHDAAVDALLELLHPVEGL